MKKIGLTTTVPLEVLIAAGYEPFDLNNLFVTSENHLHYIDIAEQDGFPKSMCAWIKGIYGACIEHDVKEIIAVMEGDCSNTKVLNDILKSKGVLLHPFSFPHSHLIEDLDKEMKRFMKYFDVSDEEVEGVRKQLNRIRKKVKRIDDLSYKKDVVSGFENHLLQLCMSDLDGNPLEYEKLLDDKLLDIESRNPIVKKLRLGYIGVPPMTGDLFDFVETLDSKFMYSEVQREFSFPRFEMATNITEQYYDYTYPYDFDYRIKEIQRQVDLRELDGIIHYTQAFCHKAAEHILLKDQLNIPILNIEGDKLNVLDARTKLRLEAFLDMLSDMKVVTK